MKVVNTNSSNSVLSPSLWEGRDRIKFIISGGGTGGHIYPAIAIANELRSRFPKAEFLFVGAQDKMEMQKVPQAGYAIKGLWIAGLQRKLTLQNLLFPVKLISSLWKSRAIIKSFKPDVVIGTGGFASGPLLQMANSLNIPTLIQEQNSYPGITNKLLSKKANKICVAYENLERFFPKEKMILTGNPVRQDLIAIDSKRKEAIKFFNLDPSKKTLLILGGSLGARRVNQLIEKEKDSILNLNVAKSVVDKNGALMIKESELDENFNTIFSDLITNENLQKQLCENIKKLAKVNATKDIVDEIVKLIK